MGITVSDIRRAILGGGDVSVFTKVCHQALDCPPVSSMSSLEALIALPEPMVLLEHIDKGLVTAVAAWEKAKDYQPQPQAKIDLTLIALAPYGQNVGKYLEQVISGIGPDIITIDSSPLELSADMLYAFSIPCAVGLPVYGEILNKDSRQVYTTRAFYPGNINGTAIVKGWLTKIPLLPIGIPQKSGQSDLVSQLGSIGGIHPERAMSEANRLTAYRTLDKSLGNVNKLEEALEITKSICLDFIKTIDGKERETLIEEACYIASRIVEIAAYGYTLGRKIKLLAVVDITRYVDTEYAIGLLEQGITDEVYLPPRSCLLAEVLVMACRNSEKLGEQAEEYAPESTLTQELFRSALDRMIKTRESEPIEESEVDKLISQIVGRTRTHPDISRGAGGRGTVAFKEVLGGLSEMNGGSLTRENISKAALITLPSRISVNHGNDERAVVSDIVKEVLYDIRFSTRRDNLALPRALPRLSLEDITEIFKNLRPGLLEQNGELTQTTLPAIIADPISNQKILEFLESRKFLKRAGQNQYSLTRKALGYLIDELEQKLKAGEITMDEYNQEKSRLMRMLESASQPRFTMSGELAKTIMEIMDAQDKQWSSEISLERMYVYYQVKANNGEDELNSQKRDYYGLKGLIDDLEKKGILRVTEAATEFTLTGEALDLLLEYLIARGQRGRGLKDAANLAKTLANECRDGIRRYSSGDVFRDISVRHSLKEIAKQKKGLSSVRRSDLRVFLKQHPKLQSDIIMCVDTSGSMRFQHKLTYARLAASGLAKAAIKNGDKVGMVIFNNYGQTTVPLTDDDTDRLTDCVVRLTAGGNTNIGDGIKCASQLLLQNRSRNRKHIILVTDGMPTAISERAFAQLKSLKEKDLSEESALLETRRAVSRGIQVSVIHITTKDKTSRKLIKDIARIGKGKVCLLSSPEGLKTIMSN